MSTEEWSPDDTPPLHGQAFRVLADSVPALLSYVDSSQRYRYVNRRYEEAFRRPASEIVGRTVSQLLGPERFELVRTHVEAALRGEAVRYESDFAFTDGAHSMHVHYVPDRSPDGSVRGFFALITDVTEQMEAGRARVRAEEELQSSEERMRAILNTAADAIITIDRRGAIVDVNPATERLFGYSRGELLGCNVSVLMPAPYREEHDGYIARYLETREARIIGIGREVEGRRKDGTVFPIDLAVSEVEHLGLFTGVIRDISDRKRIEGELQKSRNDLRAMSSELMLTEERERRQLAQDLHDGLGQALFLVNRKLSGPRLDENTAAEIRTILDSAAKTVNALTFELSPPVLRDLGLRSAVRWLARDLKKRYGLSVEVADDGSPLELDDRVTTVLFRSVRELLINTAKHAGTDTAFVRFRTRDQGAEIVVEDRGRGFDPAAQSGQVEAGHFGLFSIRERLEYLGGEMTIRSAPGEGAAMTLRVPLSGRDVG